MDESSKERRRYPRVELKLSAKYKVLDYENSSLRRHVRHSDQRPLVDD